MRALPARDIVFTARNLLTVACRYSLLTIDLLVQNETHIPAFVWVEELLQAGEERKARGKLDKEIWKETSPEN
jgi:hypothetical protein